MRFTNAGSGTQVAASGDAQVVGTPVAAGAGALAADDADDPAADELDDGEASSVPLALSGEVAGRGDRHDAPDVASTTRSKARPGVELRTAGEDRATTT
jgi:hypothetical protein